MVFSKKTRQIIFGKLLIILEISDWMSPKFKKVRLKGKNTI